jgi:hypothetical protein
LNVSLPLVANPFFWGSTLSMLMMKPRVRSSLSIKPPITCMLRQRTMELTGWFAIHDHSVDNRPDRPHLALGKHPHLRWCNPEAEGQLLIGQVERRHVAAVIQASDAARK